MSKDRNQNSARYTKIALIAKVMEETGMSRREATQAIKVIYDALYEAVCDGKEICLNNIGTIYPRVVHERKRINPTDGSAFVKPAHFALAFRQSRSYRGEVDRILREKFELPTA